MSIFSLPKEDVVVTEGKTNGKRFVYLANLQSSEGIII